MKDEEQVFVLVGPVGHVPESHQCCNLCGGESDVDHPCELCKGKGYWNADDIRQYHRKYPDVCLTSCGMEHLEPKFGPPRDIEEFEKEFKTTLARADELLKKYS